MRDEKNEVRWTEIGDRRFGCSRQANILDFDCITVRLMLDASEESHVSFTLTAPNYGFAHID
jgi:hypothetical protein